MPLRRLNLGLVLPQSGPSGIFGPSCQASAEYAIDELNAGGGILGREVTAVFVDGGADPSAVAACIADQTKRRELDAVVGWHTSAVRRRIVSAIGGRIPYVYTAVYEGGENSDGVFMTGEVPTNQILPALEWMTEIGVRKWYVIGSDYVWPRKTVSVIREFLASNQRPSRGRSDVRLASCEFLSLGTSDFTSTLEAIEMSGADGVLVLLLGQDAVQFNRSFSRKGLHRDIVRLSPLMDENMLLASGAHAAHGLYSVSGFFECLVTGHSMDFESRYIKHFGPTAPPVTSPGESCYEGIRLLATLADRAGDLDPMSLSYHADRTLDYDSPRGHVRFDGRHLAQDMYIARADGVEFDVLAQVSHV
ncbi:substrate-binding domain-containing protein [Rhodococcus aetherivorans]|uniref:substrate-binding domain-containing protein n=1 Tax=Rhodococcus aetherivorans TaxID=191292 RepID=UPI002949A3B3|nr:substrate-binding domain-containing protein [Rhodococcus aetherivorans]MDV6296680.1 substrate-binding domain-containing protein [Rhodococcus aetherivorans]